MEDSLRQFVELYRDYGTRIDSGSPDAINAHRAAALARLEQMTLPAADSENYEFTDFNGLLTPDYGLPIAPEVPPVAAGLPGAWPGGVFAGSLREFDRKYPGVLREYYGKLASLDNPIVALNTLLVQDGFILYVPAGVKVEKPIQIVNRMASGQPVLSPRRLIVIMGEDAEARLLSCDHTERMDSESLSLGVTELFIGRNARFDYYDLEESAEKSKRLSAIYMRQEEHSHTTLDCMTLFNGFTRNEFYCDMAGEHSGLGLYGMGICDRSRRLSVYSHINHGVARCHSNELFKIAADEQARCAFTGRIHVAKGAVETEAYQASRNLISGNEAVVKARPELEIYNDDVKCSHGCAVGQLDEQQMFYMRTRGIPESKARLLLRQAFMADIIDVISIPSLRDRLHILVERRFAGQNASCSCDVK